MFLNKYFRGKVQKSQDGTLKGIDCLRIIINLIYQKSKDFSQQVVGMHADPLINVVNLLTYLRELQILDQICLDEAALAIQKCLLIITKDQYDKSFFENSIVSEQIFLNKIKTLASFLIDQKKIINLNCYNIFFFICCLNNIEDQQVKQKLYQSINNAQDEEFVYNIKFIIKGMQGTLTLKDVESIIDSFLHLQELPVNKNAYVDFLINAKYSIDNQNSNEKIKQIQKLYSKEYLQKLAQSSPEALKFLFLFCFKLEQEIILSLREENNIFFDIINLLEINNQTNQIAQILKILILHLDYIFKNKQGLYEESVAGIFEYMEQCKNGIHEIKEEWEEQDDTIRLRRIIDFTETYNLFYLILSYPLEIEKIQNTFLNTRKREVVNCCYNKLPYCCQICGKKIKEQYYLFQSVKNLNLICSNCELNIPLYTFRCGFKIEISQEMRNYIHNTAQSFSTSFKLQVQNMKKIALRNSQNLSSLNAICTQFESLILTHFDHLSQQIKFEFD